MLTDAQMLRHLRRANQIAQAAMQAGRHPADEITALHRDFWKRR